MFFIRRDLKKNIGKHIFFIKNKSSNIVKTINNTYNILDITKHEILVSAKFK